MLSRVFSEPWYPDYPIIPPLSRCPIALRFLSKSRPEIPPRPPGESAGGPPEDPCGLPPGRQRRPEGHCLQADFAEGVEAQGRPGLQGRLQRGRTAGQAWVAAHGAQDCDH
eukprot:10742338-Alexandrium_andersonii.AAC.1